MRKFILSYSFNPSSKLYQGYDDLKIAMIQLLLKKGCIISSNEEGVILIACEKTFDALRKIVNDFEDDIFYTLAQVAKIDSVQNVNVVSDYAKSLYFEDEVAKIKRGLRLKKVEAKIAQ